MVQTKPATVGVHDEITLSGILKAWIEQGSTEKQKTQDLFFIAHLSH
jgi:hypothetical protein